MKYNLRSLMIVFTLVCVVLGSVMGRVEYLRRWAAHHEREEQIWVARVRVFNPGHPYLEGLNKDLDAALSKYAYHRDKKLAYQAAMYSPWVAVRENSEPSP